jgi:hypothetical protein
MGIPPLTSNVQAAYKPQDDQLPDFDTFLQSAKGPQRDPAGRRTATQTNVAQTTTQANGRRITSPKVEATI